ncbi:MAG TPA: GTPase, partial [Candidatus Paceibacterota bacterium]|nr:GTPase [Candidatus Paceibacterota bacterium]
MPINPNYEYTNAEEKYLSAKTDEEKILALEEMLKTMPKHKSAESLRKNIRNRYKKLKEKIETKKQTRKSSKKQGIKKAEMQAVLIGLTNSGKSSVLASLTNAHPKIESYPYTTKSPILGTLEYKNIKIQLIDLPAVESEYADQGIINTADVLLVIITNPSQLQEIEPFLENATKSRIIILN